MSRDRVLVTAMNRWLAGMALTIVAAGGFAGSGIAGPFSAYVDHARVLVIAAPSESDARLTRQMAIVQRDMASLRERDLTVVRIIGETASDDRGSMIDARAAHAALDLEAQDFAVVLIGKDGGVKMRAVAPIETRALFATIDAMPMRRQEMRDRARQTRP